MDPGENPKRNGRCLRACCQTYAGSRVVGRFTEERSIAMKRLDVPACSHRIGRSNLLIEKISFVGS
jgi:hypothetical protein